VSRISAVAMWVIILGAPGIAQPCNPVVDGTYCAEEAAGRRNASPSPARLPPIRNIAEDFVMAPDQPATLGAITFHGSGTKCMGLFRRGNCY